MTIISHEVPFSCGCLGCYTPSSGGLKAEAFSLAFSRHGQPRGAASFKTIDKF